MKYVLNKCFGGFSVSKDVYEKLGYDWDGYGYLYNFCNDVSKEEFGKEGVYLHSDLPIRSHLKLIKAVEDVKAEGKDPSGRFANLVIVDVPDDVEVELSEYDGIETLEEVHRSW